MKNFYDALGATIPASDIASKGGLSYLAAATAMSLADRPQATFVEFADKPYLELLGGALVAVDLPVEGGAIQRMYLPVMDRDNKSIKLDAVTVADINNNRQRALVKAIATVHGAGMSLYLGCDGDGAKAVKMLGVEPTTDLATVSPVVAKLEEGGEPYIEWNVGVAVCRITDPTFNWKVVEWNSKPYREVLGGIFVDVETTYKGKTLVLGLPVLDGKFDPVPVAKATTFDWNKTVMRALTKCIAFNTGYGLSVYADIADSKKDDKKKSTTKASAASAPAATPAPAPAAAKEAPKPETADKANAPAPVEAASTPAPAPAPAETPVVAQEDAGTAESVDRFKKVMQGRKTDHGVPGLQTLFEALKVSTKFATEHKPACYAVLVNVLASQAEGKDVAELVNNLKAYGAMAHVPADARDLVSSRITTNFLAASLDDGDDVLKAAPGVLVSAGIAKDSADVLRLAQMGGVPAATVDLLNALQETASA